MKNINRKIQGKGNTLLEVLLVVVLLGFIVALISNIPNAISLIKKSSSVGLAREIAVKQIEDKRQLDYANLINNTENINDSRMSLLPDSSGTVIVRDCDTENVCTNNEDIKEVAVTVTWKENNREQEVVLSTLIGSKGTSQ